MKEANLKVLPKYGGVAYLQRSKDLSENKHLLITQQVLALPKISIDKRDSLPRLDGIYFFVSPCENIVYAGKSSGVGGFRNRLKNHLVLTKLPRLNGFNIAYQELNLIGYNFNSLPIVENALIWSLAPKYNVVIAKSAESDFNLVFKQENPQLCHVINFIDAHRTQNQQMTQQTSSGRLKVEPRIT